MITSEVRNLFQEQIRRKLLGPGYASDLFACSPDCSDEILTTNPKSLYCTGVLLPIKNTDDETNEVVDDDDINPDDLEVNEELALDTDEESEFLTDAHTEEEHEIDDSVVLNMNHHIGLVTCVSKNTTKVHLDISYGTYQPITKIEEIRKVKLNLHGEVNNVKNIITEINNNAEFENQLNEKGLPPFQKWFVIDENKATLSISENLNIPPYNILDDNGKVLSLHYTKDNHNPNPIGMLKLLLKKPYRRNHHSLSIDIEVKNGSIEIDDNLLLFEETFIENGKTFVKFLFQTRAKIPLYQLVARMSPVDGCIVSYTDPVNTLDDDEENSINEYVYRDIRNYGKGVNCALRWPEEGTWVETTFMPVVDIKKFSNDVAGEDADAVRNACELRNLSIWSQWDDEDLLDSLDNFVNGYESWYNNQSDLEQGEISENKRFAETIVTRQKELLDRLRDNVNYLRETPEALSCFKIANTAMLIQMVISRDSNFAKNRNVNDVTDDKEIFNNLQYFEKSTYLTNLNEREPAYRPFQLAFLLMNVKSTMESNDPYRKDVVDLIWFPTGGGKTEAYLALTALSIIHRRRRGKDRGVSVLMRYTLRLLTTQQFERASYLICALEFLRNKNTKLELGETSITIGLYLGNSVTPGSVAGLNTYRYINFLANNNNNNNPFPVTYCPWCGTKIFNQPHNHGYNTDQGTIGCINPNCHFANNLPVEYIDDRIYRVKPTLLFGTVDKFAQLYRTPAQALLKNDFAGPDLIIQDELHLISGSLGSMVGFFETIIEELCKRGDHVPKIVASTATTRNTEPLVRNLYNRKAMVFPAQGLSYEDNYFSHVDQTALRRHVGIMPSANMTSNDTEIRLTANILLARVELFKKYLDSKNINITDVGAVSQACQNDGVLISLLDNYWTSVYYFNSLKDLGRSSSRVSQQTAESLRSQKSYMWIPKALEFINKNFDRRRLEFTSRIDSSKIKDKLTMAQTPTQLKNHEGLLSVALGSDLVYASNMISVGIDISRWNIMTMMGHPRSNAEYVQSSSRVARSVEGLVVNLYNPLRVREHSLFENYTSFHASYYKSVEPLSITPLTVAMLKNNVINNIVKIFRDRFANGYEDFEQTEQLMQLFKNRFPNMNNDQLEEIARGAIEDALNIVAGDYAPYAQSLREIAPDAHIKINNLEY